MILGNPPYNAFAGVSPEEEQGLVEPYKEGLNKPVAEGGWGIKKFNLDDLYVRFFRLAERRIAEMTGKGVVSFISNFSYLGDPSFVVMRQRFLESNSTSLWFDCMNGDSRETGKLTPDGKPDPSVFSTRYNREGIRVGTAVCVVVRKREARRKPIVRFRHFWGVRQAGRTCWRVLTGKRFDAAYATASPARKTAIPSARRRSPPNTRVGRAWSIVRLAAQNGLMEKRGGALIDIDRETLAERMKSLLQRRSTTGRNTALFADALTQTQARFDPKHAREKALAAESISTTIGLFAMRFGPWKRAGATTPRVRPVWNRAEAVALGAVLEGQSVPDDPSYRRRVAGRCRRSAFTGCLGDNDCLSRPRLLLPAASSQRRTPGQEEQQTLLPCWARSRKTRRSRTFAAGPRLPGAD